MIRLQTLVSSQERMLALVFTVAALLAGSLAQAGDEKRDAMKGEVSDKVAFVQTFDHKVGANRVTIEAKIKFVKAGTYVVAGGYYKGTAFHASLTGKKYYSTKVVKADAGDVLTVKLSTTMPPANKKITVAVFKSEKDITTKS
jgi:hypothetical protein